MIARAAVPLFVLGLVLAGCSPPDDQQTDSLSSEEVRQARENLDPAVLEALDQGNAAYRERDYAGALEHFQEAARLDDDVAAAWFGIYMAQLALGNGAAADSAMARAQDLAPGASLIHPERDSTP
jgi:Flp pilus assembly protein TadD